MTESSPAPDDHAALIGAIALRRDRAAFAALFRFFAPRVKAWMLRAGAAPALAEELAQEAQLQSPDVSHLVTVRAGDTLPGLCANIYGTSLYYLRVAAFNGLTSFRRLAPGTQLVFPPLSGPGA